MKVSYSDLIRRWAADTRRAGILEPADGLGEVGLGDAEAGRRLAVRFTLRVHADRIETVRYQVFGCGFTMAACAAAAEMFEGHTLNEASVITSTWVDTALGGLPKERGYCADLAVTALQAAVKSAGNRRQPVVATVTPDEDHTPRVTIADPVYRLLMDSPSPPGAPTDERHLFACVLAVAAGEAYGIDMALGLSRAELGDVLHLYFPTITLIDLDGLSPPASASPPPTNIEILDLLSGYLPDAANGWTPAPSLWLARIIAARAAHPGHLWRAMGLFARPELTAAIHRDLPALAAANDKGMRWKRFLYKQLCERSGGVMCKTPDCGGCSDYALCFAGG